MVNEKDRVQIISWYFPFNNGIVQYSTHLGAFPEPQQFAFPSVLFNILRAKFLGSFNIFDVWSRGKYWI